MKLPFLYIALLFLCLVSACSKFVQINPPINQIVTSQVFADSADATAAVMGMYEKMYAGGSSNPDFTFTTGGVTVFTGLCSDELYPTASSGNYAREVTFYTNAISSIDGASLSNSVMWQVAYPLIYQANACIEGLDTSNHVFFNTKDQLKGEASFVRAFLYFNLVNLYGAIPLVTTTNYQANALLARTSADSVYQQIVKDLVYAQSVLPVSYPSAGRVRPNQYTVTALLARVYLYRKQWSAAEVAASQVIGSNLYSLTTLNDVFKSNIAIPANKEPIWQLLPLVAGGYDTPEGYQFNYPAAPPKYVVSDSLLHAFEPGDQRFAKWLFPSLSGPYYTPYKYQKLTDPSSTPQENYMVLRLGEQYLIRAEARAQQGINLIGAVADIDTIRSRAGLASITVTAQQDILNAVYHERQVELFCEWGHRWYDLKRTGLVNAVMGGTTGKNGVCAAKGGTWDSNWQLWPIPFGEIQKDPYLTQNPGYQ